MQGKGSLEKSSEMRAKLVGEFNVFPFFRFIYFLSLIPILIIIN